MYSTPVRRPLINNPQKENHDANRDDDPFGFTRSLLRSGIKSVDFLPLLDGLASNSDDENSSRPLGDNSPIKAAPLNNNSFKTPIRPVNRGDCGATDGRKVYFAHDPELDSTPFVYYRHEQGGDASARQPNSSLLVENTQSQSAIDKRLPSLFDDGINPSGSTVDQPEEDDMFGLGAFSEVFISDKDLERAKEKLLAEQCRSKSEIVDDCLLQLKRFSLPSAGAESGKDCGNEEGLPCKICFNFMILGGGRVAIKAHEYSLGLQWMGTLVGDSESVVLHWPLDRLCDIRVKSLPDETPLLMFAVDQTTFIQLQSVDEVGLENISNQLKNSEETRQQFLRLAREDIEQRKEEQMIKLQQSFDRKVERLRQELQSRRDLVRQQAELDSQRLLETVRSVGPDRMNTNFSANSPSPNSPGQVIDECQLCYNNNLAVELEPCGHRMCRDCMDRLNGQSDTGCVLICPWDRSEVINCKYY